MTREPVAIAAAIRSLLVVGVAYGLDLTGEQIAATVVAVELVLGLFVRSRVTPEPIILPVDHER